MDRLDDCGPKYGIPFRYMAIRWSGRKFSRLKQEGMRINHFKNFPNASYDNSTLRWHRVTDWAPACFVLAMNGRFHFLLFSKEFTEPNLAINTPSK